MKEFIKKLFACFFCWRREHITNDELAGSPIIVAFSFGGRFYGTGKSNRFLIDFASSLFEQYRTPIIAQWEIGEYVKNGIIQTIKKSRVAGQYLDTYEVAYQATEVCEKLGIKKVLVLAHPHHTLRCKWTLEKLGLKAFLIDTTNCPYDPKSNQTWTRNALKFIPREILARLMYLVKGYI